MSVATFPLDETCYKTTKKAKVQSRFMGMSLSFILQSFKKNSLYSGVIDAKRLKSFSVSKFNGGKSSEEPPKKHKEKLPPQPAEERAEELLEELFLLLLLF